MPAKKPQPPRKAFLYKMRADHHAELKALMDEGRETVRGEGVLPPRQRAPYTISDLMDQALEIFISNKEHRRFHLDQMEQWLTRPPGRKKR